MRLRDLFRAARLWLSAADPNDDMGDAPYPGIVTRVTHFEGTEPAELTIDIGDGDLVTVKHRHGPLPRVGDTYPIWDIT